jgi:hypothetical protein
MSVGTNLAARLMREPYDLSLISVSGLYLRGFSSFFVKAYRVES